MNDLQQFKDTYITECFELLSEMEERLLHLDTSNADKEELNAIFRCAHSIKGGAGAFGFTGIVQFTHILETLLDSMREGKMAATREVVDILLKSRDIVLAMVTAAKEGSTLAPNFGAEIAEELKRFVHLPAGGSPQPTQVAQASAKKGMQRYRITFKPHTNLFSTGNEPLLILRELQSLGTCAITCDSTALPAFDAMDAEQCYLSWVIDITTAESEARLKEAFEFVEDVCSYDVTLIPETPVTATVSATPLAPSEPITPASSSPGNQTSSIRVDIEKVDKLINMVGEVVIVQAMLAAQTRQLPAQDYPELLRGIDELSQHTRELQESVMAIRMQPVKSIFSRMPRIVRDLSQQLGKEIRLVTEGEMTEVDKTIIEQLSDPLTHMIRNAIDHGIEKPEVRRAKGKPDYGTITLSAAHRAGRIVIEIVDDGAGVNKEKVLSKAREKGLIAPDATLSDREIENLIFAAGFSTAETVSSISGRGVGMDVVRRNIEGLGGSVFVETLPEQGSRFAITLPLTLAILDGMIVRVGREFYIIPITNIIETMRPQANDIRHIADGNCVINVRGEFIHVLYLWHLFNIQEAVTEAHKGLVVLVENGTKQIGLVVDELVGQQQVVIKSLEDNTDPIRGVSGATILGDGKVSLILDVGGLATLTESPHPIQQAA